MVAHLVDRELAAGRTHRPPPSPRHPVRVQCRHDRPTPSWGNRCASDTSTSGASRSHSRRYALPLDTVVPTASAIRPAVSRPSPVGVLTIGEATMPTTTTPPPYDLPTLRQNWYPPEPTDTTVTAARAAQTAIWTAVADATAEPDRHVADERAAVIAPCRPGDRRRRHHQDRLRPRPSQPRTQPAPPPRPAAPGGQHRHQSVERATIAPPH